MNSHVLGVVQILIVIALATRASGQDVARQLYIMNSDGSDLTQLGGNTDYGWQRTATWAPDGRTVAFAGWRHRAGKRIHPPSLFVVKTDGTELRKLKEGLQPCLSPDGIQIAFTGPAPRQGVWMMDIDGSDETCFDASGRSPQWSPDGSRIAYSVTDRGVANLRVFDIHSKQWTTVLVGEHSQRYRAMSEGIGWSPDSKRLCFGGRLADGNELTVVDAKGSDKYFAPRRVHAAPVGLSWHRDGKQLLVSMVGPMRQVLQLFVMDVSRDTPPRYLTGQPSGRANSFARWSPDGEQIVFSSMPKSP